MKKELKYFKELELPSELAPDAIYYVHPSGSDYMDLYVTDADGMARKLIQESDIINLIRNANELKIVQDIADRDALIPTVITSVFVKDATSDLSVTSGSAQYLYDPIQEEWIKTGESESLDVVPTWTSSNW